MDRIITEDGPIPEAGRWSTGYPASPAQLRSLVNHRFCCPGLDGSPPEKQSAFCPRCAQLALLAELGHRITENKTEVSIEPTKHNCDHPGARR